jgi:hypothetical protein
MYPAITRCYYEASVFCVNRTKGQWNAKWNLARGPHGPQNGMRYPFLGCCTGFLYRIPRFYDGHGTVSPGRMICVFSKMRLNHTPALLMGLKLAL